MPQDPLFKLLSCLAPCVCAAVACTAASDDAALDTSRQDLQQSPTAEPWAMWQILLLGLEVLAWSCWLRSSCPN